MARLNDECALHIDELAASATTKPANAAMVSRQFYRTWIGLLVATPNLTLVQWPENVGALRLDRYRQVLTGTLAERRLLLAQCISDLTRFALDPDEMLRVGNATVRQWVAALESSPSQNAQLHARFGRLALNYAVGDSGSRLSDEAFIAGAEAWEREANQFFERGTSRASPRQEIRSRLKSRPNRLAQAPAAAESRPADTGPARMAALPMERVAISVKRASGQTLPLARDQSRREPAWVDVGGSPTGVVNADGFDIYWNNWSILCERQPGIWEEIYLKRQTEHTGILDVAYDGQNIWAITCCQGVFVLSPDGKKTAALAPTDGIPLSDKGAKLAALSPGRVLAVGSLGRDFRGWCATLTLKDGSIAVDVFHEAMSVFDNLDAQTQNRDDPNAAFVPTWIYHVHELGRAGPPSFLLVRQVEERGPRYRGTQTSPLLRIDADRRTVEPVPYKGDWGPPLLYGPNLAFLDDGSCVMVSINEIVVISHPASPAGSVVQLICRPDSTGFWASPAEIVVPFEGRLYFPGSRWLRYDPDTRSMEVIGEDVGLHRYGVSRWHRLVEWNDEGGFRSVLGVKSGAIPDAPGYQTEERAAEILAELDRKIQAAPQDIQPWYDKVKYLYQAGRLGEARGLCDAWIRAQPHKMEPRSIWRLVVLKIRFGLDLYQYDDRVNRGRFASFAEWSLYNDPIQNTGSADRLMDAVRLPLVTDDAEWPLSELALYNAAVHEHIQKKSHRVVEICDICEQAARENNQGTDCSYLALRAAARLRLGQFEAARKDAVAAVEMEKADALWSGNALDLPHAIERGESAFTYEIAHWPDLCYGWQLRKR